MLTPDRRGAFPDSTNVDSGDATQTPDQRNASSQSRGDLGGIVPTRGIPLRLFDGPGATVPTRDRLGAFLAAVTATLEASC